MRGSFPSHVSGTPSRSRLAQLNLEFIQTDLETLEGLGTRERDHVSEGSGKVGVRTLGGGRGGGGTKEKTRRVGNKGPGRFGMMCG